MLETGTKRKKSVSGGEARVEERDPSEARKEGMEGRLNVRKHSTQVRSSLEEDLSLVKSLTDELVLI